jgi:hypothetical protein
MPPAVPTLSRMDLREWTMRPIRRAAVTGLLAFWLSPLPALAGSQSSNSSSDCDNGRCRHVESLVIEDRDGRRGWVRERRWNESPAWQRLQPQRGPWQQQRGRGRDDDDDDDD